MLCIITLTRGMCVDVLSVCTYCTSLGCFCCGCDTSRLRQRCRTGGLLITRSWLAFLLTPVMEERALTAFAFPVSKLSLSAVVGVNANRLRVNSLQALGFNLHADLFDVLSWEQRKELLSQPPSSSLTAKVTAPGQGETFSRRPVNSVGRRAACHSRSARDSI